jgi:hypothetical protein
MLADAIVHERAAGRNRERHEVGQEELQDRITRRRGGWGGHAVLLALAALLAASPPARAAEPLVPLARPGPWSAVSGLIGYGDRLWFVNSVKFVDHNSADVYSYDPVTGHARYERHLFSQDAGDPAQSDGLLYWPFEDARFSVGHGEFMVTNGREWQWRRMSQTRLERAPPAAPPTFCGSPCSSQTDVFHVHAMVADRGLLYAATSAWRGLIQRSDDGGLTWRVVSEYPSAPGSVSRLTTLAVLDGALYAGLTSSEDGVKLRRLVGETMTPVPGWPRGRSVWTVKTYRGWLYGVNRGGAGSAVWRTNGERVERVKDLDREPVRAFAAGADTIWAVSASDDRGTLWRSGDGISWIAVQFFRGAEPVDVAVYGGHVYVGTIGPRDRGTLWGPPAPAAAEPAVDASVPQPPARAPLERRATDAALATLDRVLAESASYAAHGARLRDVLEPLALGRDPDVGLQLARRLDGPFPESSVSMFGGALRIPAAKLARWYLLWALALNGHGRVPPRLLAVAWQAQPNRAEKYLEPAPAAAWAIAQLGQADDETLGALISRLGARDQPRWLDGDLVGALSAVTGKRFGYDISAWRAWHCRRDQRACDRR